MALKIKTYNNVQANVTFSKASSRVQINPTAGEAATENIALTLGKISKWYEALVPTGGSSGKILAWNTAGTAKWSDPLHPTITLSADTTSTPAQLSHGGTFTAITSVTREGNGHVTKINTATYTLPNDTSMTQTNTTGSADYRVLLSGNANDTTETTTGRKSTNLKFNPNTGVLSASSGVTTKTITRSALKGMLTGSGTAAQDKGSGVSPRYFPAKWTFNTGLTAANGDVFIIKLPTAGHSYGVFLSIDNGANYYPISVNGTSKLTTHYGNGYSIAVMFKSDGSTADVYPLAGGNSKSTVTGGCWQVLNYYDSGNSNTYDRNRYNANIKAGSSALVAGNIIVGKDGVFNHLKSGGAFDISYPILYLNEAVAASATTTNTYDILHITITTTQSITLTAYKPVFIKGTLSGTIFTPVSATPLTQTVPTTDDGYAYIYLGNATGTTTMYLQERHPIYAYKNNAFGEIVHTARNVNGYTVGKSVPSDALFTDTWIAMVGATSSANGSVGYVNAVPPKDGYNTKYLRADGSWVIPPGTYTHPTYTRTDTTSTASPAHGGTFTAIDSVTSTNGHVTAVNVKTVTLPAQYVHPGKTQTDTTSSASPAHGGTFTVVDSVTRDTYGHVSGINVKTVTLPTDQNTDTKVTQSSSTTSDFRPLLLGKNNQTNPENLETTVTDQTYVTKHIFVQPSTGNLTLYNASGDSPSLIFRRGTFVDNLNDWKIYVSGGELRFAQSTANASSETWTTKMYFHASDGNLYVGSTKVSLNGHTHSQYLPKTTYEWNKEISFGNSGYLKIGSFPMYDTNITIDINATTSKTYHGTVVIATQNVSTTSMGSQHIIHVYDDPTGDIAASLRIVWTSGSRNYDIYFIPQSWSKNFIHIRALGNYMDGATDICVSQTGTAPATTSGLEPVNILSVTSTGNGNAVTKVEIDSVGNLVVTKGTTFSTTDENVKATKIAQSTAEAIYYPTLVSGAGTAGVGIFDSARINHTPGTTSVVGNTRLILGNATASGTANNEEGLLKLYSPGTSYHTLKGASTSSIVEHTLPTTGGTILNDVTTSFTQTLSSGTKIGTIKINGTSTDLYCETNTNTDTKVTQSETTTANYRPIVFGATNSTDTSTLAATITDQAYVSTLLYAQPQNGILYANRMYLKAPGSKGQLNLLTSKYNVMLRNDDSNTYFLVTAQNDPTGTWTSARPLTINNSTGVCNINGNAATATNAANANVSVTDTPSASTNTSDSWYKSYGLLFAQNPNTTQSNTLRKSHNLRFYHSPNGTADTVGVGQLIVGNNTASGTAGNMQGVLLLYSSSSSYIAMVPTATSSSVTLTLPAVTGTVPSFTATPTSGQVVVADGTAGGVKSSGYTIATSVPSGAVFTDRYVNTASFADDSTNTAASPVKMTLTRAGSDTATVTANIPKVSSSSAGVAPKGAAVSTQSQSTKFLREDGSWAAPSYTSIPSGNVTGTGLTADKVILGNGNSTIKTSGKGITDNSSATAVTSTDTNLITARTLYYAGYLPLSGGTITGDIEYAGDGNRKIALGKNSFKYYVASNAGWAGGLSYYSNDGSTGLGYFGAYGQANTLEYHFIGGSYNAPQIKIEPTGPNLIINSEDASTPMITFFRKGSNKADWRIVNTGGNLKFQSDYTTTVGDWYDALTVEYNTGNITMKTNATFTFGKFGSASANANRHVFFKEDGANRICVNDNFKYNPSTNILTVGSITGNAANVTGTVAIANGGTGATTRLNALKNLTNENVGSSANYFLTITSSWGKGGYTSVADAKTVLGLKSAAYTESSEYAPSSHTHGNITNGGALQTTDITIASGDKLVVTDSSNSNKVARASISFDGSTTSKCLTQKGTWETPPDTKNTAGSTDTSSKIYLVGATSQAANPQTYSDNEVYTTSGVLTTKKVQVGGGSCTMEYNSTTQSLDFIFT